MHNFDIEVSRSVQSLKQPKEFSNFSDIRNESPGIVAEISSLQDLSEFLPHSLVESLLVSFKALLPSEFGVQKSYLIKKNLKRFIEKHNDLKNHSEVQGFLLNLLNLTEVYIEAKKRIEKETNEKFIRTTE